jgi:hypothetical protein
MAECGLPWPSPPLLWSVPRWRWPDLLTAGQLHLDRAVGNLFNRLFVALLLADKWLLAIILPGGGGRAFVAAPRGGSGVVSLCGSRFLALRVLSP